MLIAATGLNLSDIENNRRHIALLGKASATIVAAVAVAKIITKLRSDIRIDRLGLSVGHVSNRGRSRSYWAYSPKAHKATWTICIGMLFSLFLSSV